DAERALPEEGELVAVHAEGGRGRGRSLRGQVARLVDFPSVLAHPFGERGELPGHRRGAGLGGELGQREQADRRERVGQPERLLDIDVLVLEVIVGDVMVVVVSHAPSLLAGGPRFGPPSRMHRPLNLSPGKRRPDFPAGAAAGCGNGPPITGWLPQPPGTAPPAGRGGAVSAPSACPSTIGPNPATARGGARFAPPVTATTRP